MSRDDAPNVYLDKWEIEYLNDRIEQELDYLSCDDEECTCSQQGFLSHISLKLEATRDKILNGGKDGTR
jgi:hypothetical protein